MNRIEGVLQKQMFILGDELRRLEDEFSNNMRIRHTGEVNMGSDALFLAIRTLGIGEETR